MTGPMTPEERAAELRQLEIIARKTAEFAGPEGTRAEQEARAEWDAEYQAEHGVAPGGFDNSKFSFSPWEDS